jgi:hypothetical protein
MDSLDTTTDLENPRAVMGGNNPPSPIELLIDNLTLANVDLIARRDALVEAVGRVPETIDNDDVAGKVADFIKQISVTAKAAEDSRVEAIKPHLEAQRAVGGFFKKLTEPLDAAKARLNDRLTAHLRRKADAERARIAEEQRQAAIRAEEEAAKNQDAFGLPAVDEAPAPEPVARETKAADLSRTRGDYGSVTSLRETWEFEITDIKAIPLASLRPFLARDAIEKAIRGYVKAYQDGKPLKGVRVFKDAKAVTR